MDALEHWQERAAIMEHDGGLDLEDAEALALGEVAIAHGWEAAIGALSSLFSRDCII